MKKLFSDFNFTWALGLFGTAVGAGILFLFCPSTRAWAASGR